MSLGGRGFNPSLRPNTFTGGFLRAAGPGTASHCEVSAGRGEEEEEER